MIFDAICWGKSSNDDSLVFLPVEMIRLSAELA